MIWVIGGTKDSRDFIEMFPEKNLLIATVATEYGEELLKEYGIKTLGKKLSYDEIREFVRDEGIEVVADLSHPYAREISANAIEISKEMNLTYFRYEREEIEMEEKNCFATPEKIAEHLEALQGNILVTLGSNTIEKFKNLKNLNSIYFRVLPTLEVIQKCNYAGISPKNILALQGPFSQNMNSAMIQEYSIKHLVTKQSGKTGGEMEKVEACKKNSTNIIYLKKPIVNYGQVSHSISELVHKIINQ
ncbi:MAG: precorrin-6A reductase [Fusobacteriaceae bacterium]